MKDHDIRKEFHDLLLTELTMFTGTDAEQAKFDRAFKYGKKMHQVKGGEYTVRVVQVSSGPWVLILATYEGSEPVTAADGSFQTADDGSVMQRSFWNYIGSKTFKPGNSEKVLSQADKVAAVDVAKRIGDLAQQIADMDDWGACEDDGIIPADAIEAW